MANTEVIDIIISTTAEYFTYMLPIIGVMAGITFVVSFLMSVTIGMGRRTFKG
jgi:hypothetical protein